MMISCLVRFAACGLLWTVDVRNLDALSDLDLDKPAPEGMHLTVVGAVDGKGRAVHPRYMTPFLQGKGTLAMIRAAAADAVHRVAWSICEGPREQEVQATPDLVDHPSQALEDWLPLNGTVAEG